MAMYKCKMCGGDLEITQELSVCECLYCGSRQTLPKLNDEKKRNLHDRAGHFRRNNEYDKAMALYEQILNEDTEDAESYWSLVLCRYGIEYVEDPVSHKRVPTVNRAQFTSVLADENYKAAIRYADEEQSSIYEAEAKEIDRLQKEILEISEKEKPFDVFICYKESDANGRRTQDSVLATDLYHQLTQEGVKVFFARITLEDKLGSAYEPYIFAALNSAKVMVVLGTKKEYFEAVWVKNEWCRFLSLIKGGAKKVLIPAYRDMDPYDLPEEFSYLQAQDMSKLGFMQDLIRGIKKLTGEKEKQEEFDSERESMRSYKMDTSIEPLMKRTFMFLEDGEFDRADELCEKVLNIDPENANAYVAKLMIELRAKKLEELPERDELLMENRYFKKAIIFAEDKLKHELNHYSELILDKKYERANRIWEEGFAEESLGKAEETLQKAIEEYKGLLGWKDSEEKTAECQKRLSELQEKKQVIRDNIKEVMEKCVNKEFSNSESLQKMIFCRTEWEKLKECQDSDDLQVYSEIQCLLNGFSKKQKRKSILIGIIGVLTLVTLPFSLLVWAIMGIYILPYWYLHRIPTRSMKAKWQRVIDRLLFVLCALIYSSTLFFFPWWAGCGWLFGEEGIFTALMWILFAILGVVAGGALYYFLCRLSLRGKKVAVKTGIFTTIFSILVLFVLGCIS